MIKRLWVSDIEEGMYIHVDNRFQYVNSIERTDDYKYVADLESEYIFPDYVELLVDTDDE